MQSIIPIRYDIKLIPDLNSFKFQGTVMIDMELAAPVPEIKLNALDIAVWKISIAGQQQPCSFSFSPEIEVLTVKLPNNCGEKFCLMIEYEGIINNKMSGWYRSQYKVEEQTRYIAVTQFEESEARRVFPCMDHPSHKAVFDITLIVDQGLQTISNMPVYHEQRLAGNKKQVQFHSTPKMSTYLVFIGVGEFDMIQAVDDKRIRLLTVPGMTKYAELGLKFGKKSLEYCEQYFQSDYPLPKMDLIATPDFAYGAMENWGAITFRENLLLDYPNITSAAARQRICEIIAHEIVHQWFGNLVTPLDWKYLWLNESFATYIAYLVVNHYYPEWNAFDQFIGNSIASAMERDAMLNTTPIEITGDEKMMINASTAPIIYNKGGGILRQIEGYLGSQLFQQGLRDFINKYAYGCAVSQNFWETLETSKPISGMMSAWVSQPGFPVIHVRREENRLLLEQKRFSFLPNQYDQLWPIPLTMDIFFPDGRCSTLKTLFNTAIMEITLDPQAAAYKINHQQTGFYRTFYLDKDNFQQLGVLVRQKKLSPADRWGLENDLFALAKSRTVALQQYFDFLDNYRDETDFLPLNGIVKNLSDLYLCATIPVQQKIARIGSLLFESVLGKIGYNPLPQESHVTALLRDRLLYSAVVYGSEPLSRFCNDKFKDMLKGSPVHADIMKSIYQTAAYNGGTEAYQWLTQRFRSSTSEQERLNILIALGCVRETELIHRIKTYVLQEIPDRNKFVAIVALSENIHAIDQLWDFFVSHKAELEKLHPIHYERIMESIIPVSVSRADEIQSFCHNYMRQNRKFKDVIELSLEKLAINLNFLQAGV